MQTLSACAPRDSQLNSHREQHWKNVRHREPTQQETSDKGPSVFDPEWHNYNSNASCLAAFNLQTIACDKCSVVACFGAIEK
mmetsp:Transcript_18438/g.27522  ORF Transcript_18438/g.27522 Transcript_18438/m.27522 type:complete len:82 (+) Transcript_18438:60-305(+)